MIRTSDDVSINVVVSRHKAVLCLLEAMSVETFECRCAVTFRGATTTHRLQERYETTRALQVVRSLYETNVR